MNHDIKVALYDIFYNTHIKLRKLTDSELFATLPPTSGLRLVIQTIQEAIETLLKYAIEPEE